MRRFRSAGFLLAVSMLAACGEVTTSTDSSTPEMSLGRANEPIIVVFRNDVADAPGLARVLAAAAGGEVTHTYEHALKGFAGSFPSAGIEGIRRNPNVAYIEADGEMTISTTQTGATWGLDRIDQHLLPLNGAYTSGATGSGVTAYILDTGIRTSHMEFGGRASTGFDAIGDGQNGQDCHGHGTHVAGTVGGSTYGVAKGVDLVAVRVLSCTGSGSTSGVIAGVNWVTGQRDANSGTPAVANMSLGGGASSALDAAVNAAVAAGVTFAVAAGNSNKNACNYSPARATNALTVGATTKTDARASYSNYGSCLDLFAPGSSITSAYYTSNTATATMSGTSMASPHVAGVAALHLEGRSGDSPAAVRNAMLAAATAGIVGNAGSGSANLLLFSDLGGSGGPTNIAPTASFPAPTCTYLECDFDGVSSKDLDGTIIGYAWNFGDGGSGGSNTSSEQAPSHTFSSEGTYTVVLTVTDDDNATGVTTRTVSVTAAPPTGGDMISLSVSTRANKKWKFADLSWSGSTAGSLDVYRNGSPIATTSNNGVYSDRLDGGVASATYKVCNAGTQTCSDEVTVNF